MRETRKIGGTSYTPPFDIRVDAGHNILFPKGKLLLGTSGRVKQKRRHRISCTLRHRLVKKSGEYLLVVKGRTRMRSKSGEE